MKKSTELPPYINYQNDASRNSCKKCGEKFVSYKYHCKSCCYDLYACKCIYAICKYCAKSFNFFNERSCPHCYEKDSIMSEEELRIFDMGWRNSVNHKKHIRNLENKVIRQKEVIKRLICKIRDLLKERIF